MAKPKVTIHKYKGHAIYQCGAACEAWHVRSLYGGDEWSNTFYSVRVAKGFINADNNETARRLANWKIA